MECHQGKSSKVSLNLQRVIDAHKGAVYQVEFSPDASKVYSASEDGTVKIWQCSSGELLSSIMRHSSSVRAFDFNYDHLDLIICGQNDGTVTAWNTKLNQTIINALPDPTWSSKAASAQGWGDVEKYHTGAILSARVSANGLFLATGSEDHTCKLWFVLSLRKDPSHFEKEREAEVAYHDRLNGCIDVLDTASNEQLQFKEYNYLKMGDAPFTSEQSIELRCTFIHDAPVLAVRFSSESNVLVTGSLDSTCKIWSTTSGNQLFQINLPGPISHIYIDFQSNIYCCCQNRIVVFNAQVYSKDSELPSFWQDSEIKTTIQKRLVEGSAKLNGQESATTKEQSSNMPLTQKQISTSLSNLLLDYPDIDAKQIYTNLALYNVKSSQIQKFVFETTSFHPRDILHAISIAQPEIASILYKKIEQNEEISDFMTSLGYSKVGNIVHRDNNVIAQSGPQTDDSIVQKWLELSASDDSDYSEEEETVFMPPKSPKGKIVHFIPSHHMKIIKDANSQKPMPPIFLRSLISSGVDYPNFNPSERKRPKYVPPAKKPVALERFNEVLRGQGTQSKRQVAKPKRQGPVFWNTGVFKSEEALVPEKFLKTKGLQVTFQSAVKETGNREAAELNNGIKSFEKEIETLFTIPIVIGGPKNVFVSNLGL